jgi:predicted methyltransferase
VLKANVSYNLIQIASKVLKANVSYNLVQIASQVLKANVKILNKLLKKTVVFFSLNTIAYSDQEKITISCRSSLPPEIYW